MGNHVIDLTQSVVINCDHRKVFDFISDYRNDVHWRDEVKETALSTEKMKQGTIITQTSYLSGKMPRYTSEAGCTVYESPEIIITETTPACSYWTKSTRQVQPASDTSATFTYRLQFDLGIVKHGLGFSLPSFLVNFYTSVTMKKYLKQLKKTLE